MVKNAPEAGKGIRGAPAPCLRTLRPRLRGLPLLALLLPLATLGACDRAAAERAQALRESAAGRLGGLTVSERAPSAVPRGAEAMLTVVATGDLKGWVTTATLRPERHATGLAHLAPLLADLRAADPALVLLDAGDALNGAPSATLSGTDGELPVVTLMNALGYDAMALGNYDLALGWPALERAQAASRFRWLSANLERNDAAGGTRLAPYAVLERQLPLAGREDATVTLRIGVLGLTTPLALLGRAPETRAGLRMAGLEAAARRWVPILRGVERVDVLVGLFHSGLDEGFARDVALRAGLPAIAAAGSVAAADSASERRGFDLIVAGDAQRLSPRDSSDGETPWGVPVLEPGARGNGLAVARLHLAAEAGRWRVAGVERYTLAAAEQAHPAALARVAAPLARTGARLDEATAVRFRRVPRKGEFYRCAGALSHATALQLGAHVGGTIGTAGGTHEDALSLLPMRWNFDPPARDELGRPLVRRHLYRWMPYDEPLVLARLTGRQVALLLDGYVRHARGWRVPPGEVLWPGGLEAELPEEGSELSALRRVAGGRALAPHDTAEVWLTAFLWYGGLGLAPQVLLDGGPPLRRVPTPLRERLFALLRDPAFPIPPECARWLAH